MPRSSLLPPVTERVRVSARISGELAARVEDEQLRRADAGLVGGGSLAELVAAAISHLAGYDLEQLRRAYRWGAAEASRGRQVHLQPRVSADHAEYLELARRILRQRLGERSATRREVLITALNEFVPPPPDP